MEVRQSCVGLLRSIMSMAENWADMRSKGDTKVGAAVYHHESGAMFLGYNGFPHGVPDRAEWWGRKAGVDAINKHDLVIHAEANAIRKAWCMLGDDLSGCELFTTMRPCSRCVKDFIAPSGIKTVWFTGEDAEALTNRDKAVTDVMCAELGIQIRKMS